MNLSWIFIHSHILLVFLTPPLLWNIDPKYLKHPFRLSFFSYSSIVPCVISLVLKLHFMYYVLLWLNLKPCNSNSCLHYSNLAFTPFLVSSTKHYVINKQHAPLYKGTSPCINRVISSRITAKGLKVDPWWRPIVIRKSYIVSLQVPTFVFRSRRISNTILIYFSEFLSLSLHTKLLILVPYRMLF